MTITKSLAITKKINMPNLTEEQKKYLIVLVMLVIISIQLSILDQQRMSMTMIALNFT